MPTPEDIAAIKRRLGALEYEFGQLQRLVAALEASPLPGMAGTSGSALFPPVIGVTTPTLSQTTLPEASPPVAAPVPAPLITARAQPTASALPPLLPPVMIPGVQLPQLVAPAPILVLLLPHTPTGPDAWLWFAAVGAWAAPLWLTASRSRQENLSAVEWRGALLAVHVVLATGLLLLALMENLKGEARLVGLVVAAGATLVIAWRARLGAALEASWLMWCAVLALGLQAGANATAWMAAGVAWLPAILLARIRGFQPLRATPPSWRARADAVQVALAAAFGGCLALEYAGSRRLVAFAVVIGTAFAVWRVARVSAARPAVVALAAAAWFSAVVFSLGEGVFGWGGALASVLGTAALVLGLPFLMEHDCDPIQRTRLRWPAAAAGLGLAFLVLLVQRDEVAPYATVGCGLAAVGTFLAGLVARSRPHRLCGLAGLALCVPRAFLVDLNSTLHRIVAFVALGVVLLWVGFSYHRFRHLIVEEDKKL